MSYRVVVMIPSKAYPGNREVCFCELRYSVKRRFIWFVPRVMDVSICFGARKLSNLWKIKRTQTLPHRWFIWPRGVSELR